MKPHQHNAGCGDHFCFHGAFRLKSDAVRKEQSTPGAFIKSLNYPPYSISDQRYAVLTRKANPEMPGPPAHMKLGRHDLRRYNQAREWMEDHRQEYPSAQALAQEAAAKYGLQVKDLLPAAKAAKNPFFTRRQKRKMKQATRHALRSGVLRLFGIKQRKFKFGTRKSRAAQPSTHRRSSPSSGVRGEVISALQNQGYNRKAAESMVPAAQGGDTFESLFRRAMARSKPNPELTPKEREAFHRATEFFRGFHGSEPTRVIRKEATIIESGDYSMVGKLVGYDMSEFPIKPFSQVKPNVAVKDNLIEDKKDPIMLVGGSIERVPVEDLDYIPPWVKPDKDGKVLVAHQLMIIGGNQNLEPVLESHFGITSTADLLILGELANIWYLAKKKQDHYQLTNYHHTFGEEEKTPALKRAARPWLMYDRVHQKQFIVGGNYSIALEGIRN